MFIEEIKKPEKTLGDKFEHFGKELGELCDEAFSILEDKKMDEKERAEFNDIVAAVSEGVFQAVAQAMGGGSSTSNTEIAVYMDSEVVARAADRGNRALHRRYSVSLA